MVDGYAKAAEGVLRQMHDELPIVVHASGKIVKLWILRAEDARRRARGSSAGAQTWRAEFQAMDAMRVVDFIVRFLTFHSPLMALRLSTNFEIRCEEWRRTPKWSRNPAETSLQ